MKKINLMLGGIKPKKINHKETWCGVDGGAIYLLKKGIYPKYSFGDFDSISDNEKKELTKKSILFEKTDFDYTDSEFAINKILELHKDLETINIYGATGKRIDHFYGNTFLLRNEKYKNLKLYIKDDNNLMFILKKGKYLLKKKEKYKYISLVPVEKNTIVSIKNAKYSRENLLLTTNRPNATSNEFLDKDIEITTNNHVLIIYSKD